MAQKCSECRSLQTSPLLGEDYECLDCGAHFQLRPGASTWSKEPAKAKAPRKASKSADVHAS